MVFSDSICKYCRDTGRNTGAYIVLYQGRPVYHCTHVPGAVAQSSPESQYNQACNAVMDIENFIMINNELLNKDPDVVL